MSNLSPAVNAILDAYDNLPWDYDTGDFIACAAVLRAAALYCKRDRIQLLAIADELEAMA